MRRRGRTIDNSALGAGPLLKMRSADVDFSSVVLTGPRRRRGGRTCQAFAGPDKDATRSASHGKSPRGRVCTAWSCGKSTNEAALCTWRVRCSTAAHQRSTIVRVLRSPRQLCGQGTPGLVLLSAWHASFYWSPRITSAAEGHLTLRCGSWRALCGQWYGIRVLRAALAQRWRASRLLHVSCGHPHRGLVSRSRHHSWEGRPPS